jgi:hypothetical protein
MRVRLVFHVLAFALLIGIGIWIAYLGIYAPTHHVGPLTIDLEAAVMYWFALLVYSFICLLLYYPVRRRSWPILVLAHGIAVMIALASTATVVTLGQRHAEIPIGMSTDPDAAEADAAAGAPPGQPLPLPSPADSPEPSSDARTSKEDLQ